MVSRRRRVLAWDAPNIDMTLTQLLGRRPGPPDRPDLRALLRWFQARRAPGEHLEAAVFVNVPPGRQQAMQGWVAFLTSIGFRVFAKPKEEGSDIDESMVTYIKDSARDASEIIISSNDARAFLEQVREISGQGVSVTVIGFAELAGELAEADEWEFVDLEEVPGLLQVTLNRIRLDQVPPGGGWFEPRVSLDAPTDAESLGGEPEALVDNQEVWRVAILPRPVPKWFFTVYGGEAGRWDDAKRACRATLVDWARQGRYGYYGELVDGLAVEVPTLEWPEGPHTHEGQQIGYLLGQVSLAELSHEEDRAIMSALVVQKTGDDAGLPSYGFWSLVRELGLVIGNTWEARYDFWIPEFRRCLTYWGQSRAR